MLFIKYYVVVLITCLVILSSTGFAQGIVSEEDVRQYNLGLGNKVFHDKCMQCHGDVEFDAPHFQDIGDWGKRIQTPVDELISHAINGHGNMPAKGGYDELTDRQVSAAVAYVVDQTRRLIISSNGELALNEDDVCNQADEKCSQPQIDNRLVLQLLMLLTNQK